MSRESVQSLAAKRVRRQKIFIAVGSVALLAILGFELPKVMGGKGGSDAVATTTAPALTAGGAPAPVVPAGKLPNTDQVAVVRDSNQLISFGLFKSKDPFVQQLDTNTAGTTTAAAPPSAPAPATAGTSPALPGSGETPVVVVPLVPQSSTSPSAPSGLPGLTPGSTGAPSTTTPAAPVPAPTDALIATNGVCERVSVKGTFPTDENIFRLVSIAKNGKSVEVGVVGGSFDNGHPTAMLKVGEKITLVNTADGTRYEIVLKTSCNLTAPAGGSAATQSTTTTPVAPAPATTTPADPAPATTTATTPIVTDTLDTTTPTG
jgi:hypothetical protein